MASKARPRISQTSDAEMNPFSVEVARAPAQCAGRHVRKCAIRKQHLEFSQWQDLAIRIGLRSTENCPRTRIDIGFALMQAVPLCDHERP